MVEQIVSATNSPFPKMSSGSSNVASNMKISVVIITCERPDYLRSSLESVFKQSHQPYEVIVVNDCSTADYSEVLAGFSDHDINYVLLPVRSGANVARNTGVELASGDVIAFLDDDDIWLNDFLASHHQEYSSAETIGAIICGHRLMESDNVVNINEQYEVTADELRHGNRFSGMSGFSAKTSVLREHVFDPQLKNGQDWDLFVRLIQHQIRFVNIQKALFLYREGTPGGITAKVKKMKVDDVTPRLESAIKHKDWLGEKFYKKRVSEQILSFLPVKSNKLGWINKSIAHVGFIATVKTLANQIRRKFIK
jgi:glycosyltransferase involved in cell wall biosynthesis